MNSAAFRWLLLALVVLPWFFQAGALWAQQPYQIRGRVLNGTPGATVPQRLTITLHVWPVGDREVEYQTFSDEEGRFAFADVPVGSNLTYTLVTEYLDVLYSVRVDPSKPEALAELRVYETAAGVEGVSILENTLLIVSADPGKRVLVALEQVRLENRGDRTLVADLTQDRPMSLLRFSLPPAAKELDVQSDLQGGNVVPVDKGFAITSPVTPGEHELLFTYLVPYTGAVLALPRSFPFGIGTFRLLVADTVGETRGVGLNQLPPVSIGERQYQVWEAQSLGAGSRLEFVLSGLPQPSFFQRARHQLSEGSLGKVGIVAMFAASLGGLVVYVILLRRPRGKVAAEVGKQPGERATERQVLIASVAELDDLFEAERVEEDAYRKQRQELMDQLVRLTPDSGAR
ncbi:MAG: carboxypeptidase regulatory-like domain-containing protein [Chloroflexi bacterium]|nr:carboxypeptidase regulatory-like domain-containing protein [Chloroflexota bacterium]